MLVDNVRIYVRAGKGGNGCESFENRGPRKDYPTGGHGGKGGDVIFRADTNVRDLEFFKFNPRVLGNNGTIGRSNRKAGKQGDDLVIKVPIGTTIHTYEDNYLIRDLACVGDEVIVARGGRAGRGNQDNKTRTDGLPGEELTVVLDFKLTSDVVFVGLPNSGKTTLLGELTNAKVRAADFAFSTKAPQLGSFECADYRRMTLLDLPSLMPGAHDGKGIGNRFLKHVERARVIFLVVDCVSLSVDDIEQSFAVLCEELSAYNTTVLEKPLFCVMTKDDEVEEEILKKYKERLKKKYKNVYNVCALTGEGFSELMQGVEHIIYPE